MSAAATDNAVRVSVLLPVHRLDGPSTLARAVSSITQQTLAGLELLLIANGSDAPTLRDMHAAASGDPRTRVIELPEANLAAALNEGMRQARSELVARMDADDWSHPDRLQIQCSFMDGHPEVAAVGSSWDRVTAGGGRERVVVPTDPRELRWRLLLENPVAHGSMVLRRSMVTEVGGYDPACTRAQDYDLWLRLAARHPVAAVPEVLYEYTARHAGGREESVELQAMTAARSLVRAWSGLAGAVPGDSALASAIAPIVGGGRSFQRAIDAVEGELANRGPTAAAMIARLWLEWQACRGRAGSSDLCRLARVREVVGQMKAAGASRAWVWGAGRHTEWLIEHAGSLGLPVAGIVDDHAAGQVRGSLTVEDPGRLTAGEHVLISSDGFEDQIWGSSASVRGRGVRVWRLYGQNPADHRADKRLGS
ncbi:MAG: hypothetical protein GIKADHBN_02209 [Phycisphaerales bacterium]|nr:hypothetical protein [Phycisphaerales bacterium]